LDLAWQLDPTLLGLTAKSSPKDFPKGANNVDPIVLVAEPHPKHFKKRIGLAAQQDLSILGLARQWDTISLGLAV